MATVVVTTSREATASARHAWPQRLVVGWHLLSLDAACVAALWAVAFAHRYRVALPWTAPAALALAVWMLYVLDRLADAQRGEGALAERHHFHYQHRYGLGGAVAGAVPALALLIALLPHALREGWILLALPMALYVAAVHLLRWRGVPKELLVGVFFAFATMMPVLVSKFPVVPFQLCVLAIAFGALCWLNCVAIARWEYAVDGDALTGWAVRRFVPVAAGVAVVAVVAMVWQPMPGLACLLSVALLLLLERVRPQGTLLRALADAALLTPLLTLLR